MKNLNLLSLGILSLLSISAEAQVRTQDFNAPDFLSRQNASDCAAKKLIDYFKKEQLIETDEPKKFNSNGKEEVNTQVGHRLDGQTIQSINMGYWLKVRMLDSGLGGETLSVYFLKDSCTPTKAFKASGGEFYQIRLLAGQCVEPRKRPVRVRPGTPTAEPTPPPPQSIQDKFCSVLKGDQS